MTLKVKGLGSLGVAQLLALLAALASGTAYARFLDAATLAGWAVALAAARAALLLLDAGLKTALVRRSEALGWAGEQRIQRGTGALALLLVALVAAWVLVAPQGWVPAPGLLVLAVAAYLISHALLLPALVRLERECRFDAVGRAEAAGTLIEFGAPALLLALQVQAWPALAAGVVAGRLVRAGLLVGAPHHALQGGAPGHVPGAVPAGRVLLREALQLQAVALLSMVRDTLHLWLVGPWFGAAWAGAYAFAVMACMVASQALVSLAARVALPALRPLSPAARVEAVSRALRLLALLVLPPLAALALLAVWGGAWVDERWHDTLGLLPALVLRIVLALPLALFGPLLLVAAPPAATLGVHLRWTTVETVAAVLALLALGPRGLAWMWPCGGALGLWLYGRALQASGVSLAALPGLLLRRPGPLRWGH